MPSPPTMPTLAAGKPATGRWLPDGIVHPVGPGARRIALPPHSGMAVLAGGDGNHRRPSRAAPGRPGSRARRSGGAAS
jgi:hypothetical protein